MGHGHEVGSQPTGGVKPMSIGGRLIYEKERMQGMTDVERAWRAKWLKDQVLTAREPVMIPSHTKELLNPIRRFFRKPLDVLFFKGLQPLIGPTPAFVLRFYTGKALMGLYFIYASVYYFKYNTNNWERKGGWRIIQSRKNCFPGEEGYPKIPEKTQGSDYCDRDFKNSIFGKKAQGVKCKEDCSPKFVF